MSGHIINTFYCITFHHVHDTLADTPVSIT